MNCSEFMARFSDFYDRGADCEDGEMCEAHLASCASCRRYEEVVRGGVNLLRSLTDAEIPEDFHLRLQHRLFHIDEEQAIARGGSSASGTTTVTALAMAVLIVLVAWSPSMLAGDPEFQLPAIVINEPAPRTAPRLMPAPVLQPRNSGLQDRALWNHSHSLLFEYSPLSDRNRTPLVRTGLD